MRGKVRADVLLVEQGLAESRSQAQRLIMAGQVRAAGELVHKASQQVERSTPLTVQSPPAFVSRGGEKLVAALEAFEVGVEGAVCADVGASTGGFTDCLLQRGAAQVYAIDVGRGQLHWKLRGDPRIHLMEGVNARQLESLPEPVDLVTIDVSFISLAHILPRAASWLKPGGEVVALIKPQFEAGREQVGKGGVVKDPKVHRAVARSVLQEAEAQGLAPVGAVVSPLKGPKGNVEFFVHCRKGAAPVEAERLLEKWGLAEPQASDHDEAAIARLAGQEKRQP